MRAADQFGSATSVWLELLVGGEVVAGTDESWRSAVSHVIAADLIAGQIEDRRRVDPAALLAAFDDSGWSPVTVAAAPDAPLVEYEAPPVRRVQEVVPVSIATVRPGVQVVDLGQNINGWTRLTNLGPLGTELTLTHGEWLGVDGDVTTDHLRVDFPFLPEPLPAGQVDRVISAGVPGDVFEPRLTTHGFRYVRVEGHADRLDVEDVRGIVVHNDLERTGWFECDDERINRLHDAVVWSLRGNMCEIPTDCPHRERAGWTGDWQIFTPVAAFLYDVERFARKWLADVRLAQRDDGMIANQAPSTPAEGFAGPAAALHGSAGWGDVIVLSPWALYEAYGDATVLEESWDAMARWVAYEERSARDGRSTARAIARPTPAPHERYLWDTGFHWGEWLEPGFEIPDFEAFVAADKSEVATAYLHRSAATMARIAEVLGKPAETIEHYAELAAATREAWQHEYLADDGSLITQTQAGHARALMFGLVPDELAANTAARLAALVRDADTTVGTGFLSTGMLLPALAEHGHLDLAYELLLQPNEPGWMCMIDRGATTTWERWNGVDAAQRSARVAQPLQQGRRRVLSLSLRRWARADVARLPHVPRQTPAPVAGSPGCRSDSTPATARSRSSGVGRPPPSNWTSSVPAGTEASIELPNGESTVAGPGRHTLASGR